MIYDAFQQKAIDAINANRSVLVSAPTGAGKTAIAEYAITKALENQERVVYTAPIKALSNQKYRDFSARYGDKVGLLTGDVAINPHAPLLIMTTEIYRNRLFEDHEHLETTSWVIFDEVHYLDDRERGTVWEEAIMFSPKKVRFVMLSATAPNIQEIADWIAQSLGYPIEIILEGKRPVPLVHFFQCQNIVYKDMRALKKEGYLDYDSFPSRFARDRQQRHRGRSGGHFFKHLRAKPNNTADLIRSIREKSQMPCLYFAFSRKRAEALAWDMKVFDFMSADEKLQVRTLFDQMCERYDLQKEAAAIDMRNLLERGIGFHHAGMLPTLKEVVERLFTEKLIKLIFTTETFALGINMPARSVVFDDVKKFYGTHFGYLKTRDFYQMAGRAGRRGMDTEGYVYTRVNPHEIQHSALTRIIYGRPEPIESQFNSCYATLLNLYQRFGAKLIEIYPDSFHYFQSNKKSRQKGFEAIERKLRLLRLLGHTSNEGLTAKGIFASWMYGYELILSEMMQKGHLELLTPQQLSVLLCALVFEPRKNQYEPQLSSATKTVAKNAFAFLRQIHKIEEEQRVYPPTKEPFYHLSNAIEAWMGGCLFYQLENHTDVDAGEIIRYFRMTLQLLRQIRNAPGSSPKLKETAKFACEKIDRDVVDAEKQLRG